MTGGRFIAALLAIVFFRMLLPDMPHHVAYWRVLLASVAGALVSHGINVVGKRIRARRRSGILPVGGNGGSD